MRSQTQRRMLGEDETSDLKSTSDDEYLRTQTGAKVRDMARPWTHSREGSSDFRPNACSLFRCDFAPDSPRCERGAYRRMRCLTRVLGPGCPSWIRSEFVSSFAGLVPIDATERVLQRHRLASTLLRGGSAMPIVRSTQTSPARPLSQDQNLRPWGSPENASKDGTPNPPRPSGVSCRL